jgi:hypothetical protein
MLAPTPNGSMRPSATPPRFVPYLVSTVVPELGITKENRCLASSDAERRAGLREGAQAGDRSWQSRDDADPDAANHGRVHVLLGERRGRGSRILCPHLLDAVGDSFRIGQQLETREDLEKTAFLGIPLHCVDGFHRRTLT